MEYAKRRECTFRELKNVHSEWSMEFEAGNREVKRWAWRNKQGQVTRGHVDLWGRKGCREVEDGSEGGGGSAESNPQLLPALQVGIARGMLKRPPGPRASCHR